MKCRKPVRSREQSLKRTLSQANVLKRNQCAPKFIQDLMLDLGGFHKNKLGPKVTWLVVRLKISLQNKK